MLLASIVFIFLLGFLILIHEFGHFIAAKKSGVEVEEFGIGFPPRIFGKKIKGTIYSINYIPFGGFVRILGENPDKENLKNPKSFSGKPPWIKAIILLAGVSANILITIIIFYCFLGFNGFQSLQLQSFDYQFPFGTHNNNVLVSMVAEESPADIAGIKPYDLIISSGGEKFENTEMFINFINDNKGTEVSLLLKNLDTGGNRAINIIPRIIPPEEEGAIGVAVVNVSQLKYSGYPEKMLSGVLHTFNMGHFTFSTFGHLIKTSVQEKTIKPLSNSVSGPVGVLAFTKLSMEKGFWQVLNLMAVVSLGLALINILPIPAADGGRLVFVMYEVIFRRRVPNKIENNVNIVGFFLLILLLVLITYKDVLQFKDVLF